MTKNTNTKKKSSASKKLIPAIGMLTVSAMMLSTATYAWFTMSREVEVTNISMVATTPEDIQISLGRIGSANNAPTTTGNAESLSGNTGVLVGSGTNGVADNGQVAPPAEMWDWSDTADFAHYYQLGKLMPASSNNGVNIFFTPDANGVGKTVKSDARYWTANGSTVNDSAGVAMSTVENGSGTAKATLHAVTAANDTWASTASGSTDGTGGYNKSLKWNDTQDDGYYVDIPVWLRTSSSDTTTLTVKGYVAPRTKDQKSNSNNEALYKAVRVAILDVNQDLGGNSISGTGLIDLRDGLENMTSGTAGTLSANPFNGDSILDWYNAEYNNGAVGSVNAEGSGANYVPAATLNTNNVYNYDTGFVTLKAGTGGEYGAPSKFIVRVWLEGNDPDCWNDTAGQDWYINLKFGRADEMDNANITGARVNDGDSLTNDENTAHYGDATP